MGKKKKFERYILVDNYGRQIGNESYLAGACTPVEDPLNTNFVLLSGEFEVREPEKMTVGIEVWANIYIGPRCKPVVLFYKSKRLADAYANANRVACVVVKKTFEVEIPEQISR